MAGNGLREKRNPASKISQLLTHEYVFQVVFAIYTQYLIRFVQSFSSKSNLSMEVRNALVHRVYQTGLTYLVPNLTPNPSGDPKLEIQRHLYSLYETGQITAAQYHHMKDREYEEIHGMRLRPRIGKLTEEDTGVIDAFVEAEPGEREARLRAQVEVDVGVGEFSDEEGITGRDGKVLMLHRMDRRAVEFRERLRTWFVGVTNLPH